MCIVLCIGICHISGIVREMCSPLNPCRAKASGHGGIDVRSPDISRIKFIDYFGTLSKAFVILKRYGVPIYVGKQIATDFFSRSQSCGIPLEGSTIYVSVVIRIDQMNRSEE